MAFAAHTVGSGWQALETLSFVDEIPSVVATGLQKKVVVAFLQGWEAWHPKFASSCFVSKSCWKGFCGFLGTSFAISLLCSASWAAKMLWCAMSLRPPTASLKRMC